jgi:hypothetical protein
MSEHEPKPLYYDISQAFGFTEQEVLYTRISDERFQQLLDDEQTTIHQVILSTNNYGEFMFVTASRPGETTRQTITMWSLGLHEYRERWVIDEWFWYPAPTLPGQERDIIPKEDVEKVLAQRRDEIAHYGTPDIQTRRGKLFEYLADLSDEDFAWSEIEDLE